MFYYCIKKIDYWWTYSLEAKKKKKKGNCFIILKRKLVATYEDNVKQNNNLGILT